MGESALVGVRVLPGEPHHTVDTMSAADILDEEPYVAVRVADGVGQLPTCRDGNAVYLVDNVSLFQANPRGRAAVRDVNHLRAMAMVVRAYAQPPAADQWRVVRAAVGMEVGLD